MGQPLAITRIDLSAAELRAHAARSTDGAVVRRLLALALALEGHSRESAAGVSGMSRQTLGDWVHRYNAEGVAGLASRSSPGRPPVLSAAQKADLKALVLGGPDPERHAVVRWRCCDLRTEIAARWSVSVCEQTVGRWLHQLGLTRVQPRPSHPRKDAAAEAAFKKTSPPW
jgi:transposase